METGLSSWNDIILTFPRSQSFPPQRVIAVIENPNPRHQPIFRTLRHDRFFFGGRGAGSGNNRFGDNRKLTHYYEFSRIYQNAQRLFLLYRMFWSLYVPEALNPLTTFSVWLEICANSMSVNVSYYTYLSRRFRNFVPFGINAFRYVRITSWRFDLSVKNGKLQKWFFPFYYSSYFSNRYFDLHFSCFVTIFFFIFTLNV